MKNPARWSNNAAGAFFIFVAFLGLVFVMDRSAANPATPYMLGAFGGLSGMSLLAWLLLAFNRM